MRDKIEQGVINGIAYYAKREPEYQTYDYLVLDITQFVDDILSEEDEPLKRPIMFSDIFEPFFKIFDKRN